MTANANYPLYYGDKALWLPLLLDSTLVVLDPANLCYWLDLDFKHMLASGDNDN